jgi:hypothetical protein
MLTAHGRMRTLIAVAALGVAVAVPSAASANAVRAPSASDALATAISSIKGLGYNVHGTSGSTASGGTGSATATGSVDPTAKAATVEFKGSAQGTPIDIAFTEVDNTLYGRFDIGAAQSQLGTDPEQWYTIDQSKITNPHSVPFDLSGETDAFGVGGLMTSTNDVKYPDPSDPTHITGTVDLTAAQGVNAPDPSTLGDAGQDASATPFSATIDSQGRLTDIKINADGFDGDLSEEIAYTDFGSPTPVTAPANSTPAPASAYAFFN